MTTKTCTTLLLLIVLFNASFALSPTKVAQQSFPKVVMVQDGNKLRGGGSFFSKEGDIITNFHVINNVKDLNIVTYDGKQFKVKIHKVQKELDLVWLKVEGGEFPFFKISKNVKIGQKIYAVGHGASQVYSITQGIISKTNASIYIGDTEFKNIFLVDAAINPGSSGGALVDKDGNFLGVTFAMTGQGQTLGLVIPAATVQKFISN